MAVFEAIIRVRAAAIGDVVSCGFDSFVEATALDVIPGVIRTIPIVTVLREAGGQGRRRSDYTRCREQEECCTAAERCDAEPVEIHRRNLLFQSSFNHPATNAKGQMLKMPTEYVGTGINTDYFGVLCLRLKECPTAWPGILLVRSIRDAGYRLSSS